MFPASFFGPGAIVPTPPLAPLGGIIWPNPRTTSGNLYVQDGYTYLRTGVLALKSAYPMCPSTYNLLVTAGFVAKVPRNLASIYGARGLAFGNALAVMPVSGGISYTSDAVTWSATVTTSVVKAITFGAGVFVLFDIDNPNSTVQTSANATSWTARTMPSTQQWAVSDFAGGKFMAVATASAATATAATSDAITWSSGGTTPAHSGVWLTPLRVGAAWILIETGVSTAYSTNDGGTWNAGTSMPAGWSTWSQVTNGAAVVVSQTTSSSDYRYTLDGINWATGTFPAAATWALLPIVGGVFLAKACNSTSESEDSTARPIYYSADGVTWTPTGQSGIGVFKIGAMYYMITSATTSKMSTDLNQWTDCDSFGLPARANAITAYGVINNRLVTVAPGSSTAGAHTVHDYSTLWTGEATALTVNGFTGYVRAS